MIAKVVPFGVNQRHTAFFSRFLSGALIAIIALALIAATEMAYSDELPTFRWEQLLDANEVGKYLNPRMQRMAAEPKDFDLRINNIKLLYILWRLEKNDNGKRLKYSSMAIKIGKEAIALRPKDPAGYFWTACAVGMLGATRGILDSLQLLPEVKSNFEKSVELNPNFLHGNATAHLGHMFIVLPGFPVSLGDKKKGFAYLQAALKKDPADSLAYLYLGDFYWTEGKLDLATEYLQKIATLKAQDAEQYFVLETSKRKAAEILKSIRDGVQRDPLYDVTNDLKPTFIR